MKVAVGELGHHDGGNALNEDNHLLLTALADLDESALDTVEHAADNTNRSALGKLHLIGGEVDESFAKAIADTDEMLHLILGDGDGDVLPPAGTGEVLEVVNHALQRLDALTGGVNEDQVADGGNELADLAATAVAHHLPTHRDEAAGALTLKVITGLELTTEGGAHGKPLEDLGTGRIMTTGDDGHDGEIFRMACSSGSPRPALSGSVSGYYILFRRCTAEHATYVCAQCSLYTGW